MRTVRQLLEAKASPDGRAEVIAIAPDAAVIEAIRLMAEKGIGALLVMDGPRLVGILSERDYARKVVLEGRSSKDTAVREIMSADVVAVRPDDSTDACMQLVTDRRIRHLPVRDGDDVVGVVSIGDLVKAVIEDQQLELDQLQRYIAS
jgi:CBS domain-containing protein